VAPNACCLCKYQRNHWKLYAVIEESGSQGAAQFVRFSPVSPGRGMCDGRDGRLSLQCRTLQTSELLISGVLVEISIIFTLTGVPQDAGLCSISLGLCWFVGFFGCKDAERRRTKSLRSGRPPHPIARGESPATNWRGLGSGFH